MSGIIRDLAGKRIGRLVMLYVVKRGGTLGRVWLCRCDCGTEKVIPACQIGINKTNSCGCGKRERAIAQANKNATHGMSKSREFSVWHSMLKRCHLETDPNYHNYGARGIIVCDAWRKSFKSFYLDMGPRPINMTIDRIDNNGNYEPSNCKWATSYEQCRNKRNNRWISYNGVEKTLVEWSNTTGICRNVIVRRIDKGWSSGRALGFES